MPASPEFRYRVIYEQLSRFSGNLSQTTTLDGVNHCLRRHLKYLFDYQLVRLCFYQQTDYIIYTLSLSDSIWQTGNASLLCPYEHELQDNLQSNAIPVVVADAEQQLRSVTALSLPDKAVQLWHWNLLLGSDSGILVSVFSSQTQPFHSADVSVLKIVLENIHAKIQSIRLFDELSSSKQAVDRALEALQHKNATISRLVTSQEAVIRQRTQALELRNAQLVELSRQHAHTLREPLSRLLSLAYLIEVLPVEAAINDIVPALKTTSADLDDALQHIIRQIDAQLPSPV